MRLGLLGGSFNPIHHGHLITALRAAEAASLDRVLFIPAAVSPLKPARGLAPARERWALLKAAIRGNPLFRASDLELRRGGVSYSVDTLRELQASTGARLYWILGTDAARLLPKWKSIDEVHRLAEFIVVARPGDSISRNMTKDHIVVRAPLLEISSSEIRERVRKGLSVRYFVPDAVERLIRRKGLYR
jgi:nicotinate-nucleotide adenylyltransferase